MVVAPWLHLSLSTFPQGSHAGEEQAVLHLLCEPARPNPSLKLTRYGRHCKPGLSQSNYRLSPGLQYLPTRAA
jgi:hypothetical protein